MQPDDVEHTVIRVRPDPVAEEDAGTEPEDIESDTFVPMSTRTAMPVPSPSSFLETAEPHPLVEPPRGHPAVWARPDSSAREGLPANSDTLIVPWHRIRINRQEPIPLNTPAVIGRSPVSPRIAVGGLPRLVPVPSPGREVSNTHVELRQQGSSVIVTDLRSTNGTIVSIPGSPSQKLRQGESLVVSAGTVVDIGDGNTVEVLPTERLA